MLLLRLLYIENKVIDWDTCCWQFHRCQFEVHFVRNKLTPAQGILEAWVHCLLRGDSKLFVSWLVVDTRDLTLAGILNIILKHNTRYGEVSD